MPDLARRRNRHRLLILAYHGLRAQQPPVGTSWSLLPVAEFERQVGYLTMHYRVAPLDEAIRELMSGGLREPTACITFDDGYRSNYTLGLDVLARYRAPATVYLATGYIGTGRLLWTTELDLAFQQTTARTLDLRPLGFDIMRPDTVEQRAQLARRVIGRMKMLAPEARNAQLQHVRETLQITTPGHGGAYSFMDWDEVIAMEQSGWIRLGAHTVNHEIVARLEDQELDREIAGSVGEVRRRVRRPSSTFAYPNGTAADFDARAAAAVSRAGCIAAVSTIEGLSDVATNPFALRRYNIGSDMEFNEFRMLTSGALSRRAQI